MIVFLSYLIAVVLTVLLAIILYPIAVVFWIFGVVGKVLVWLFGVFEKISDNMFKFTTKVIRSLWKDIGNMSNSKITIMPANEQWKCACGAIVFGKFCNECGASKPTATTTDEPNDAESNVEEAK